MFKGLVQSSKSSCHENVRLENLPTNESDELSLFLDYILLDHMSDQNAGISSSSVRQNDPRYESGLTQTFVFGEDSVSLLEVFVGNIPRTMWGVE